MNLGDYMTYIAIGCLGFVAIHLLDIVSLKKASRVKPFTWIPGIGLLVYSLVMVSLQPAKLPLSPGYTALGWLLLLISGLPLLYSLFLNIPFRETYIATGVSNKLVTTGLYSLVRHPGVLWFALFMISLILVSRASLMLIAAPLFIFLDIILVIVQDRFFFGKMFDGYAAYRRETPMLVPNRHSLNIFISSIKQNVKVQIMAEGGTSGRNS